MEIASFQMYLCKSDRGAGAAGPAPFTMSACSKTGAGQNVDPEGKKKKQIREDYIYLFFPRGTA